MLRKRKWLFVLVTLMAAMSLALAGCGTDNADGNLNGTVAPPVEEPLDEEPLEEEPLDEPTPTVAPTDEEPVDEEPTAEPTEPATAGGFGGSWVLASRLVGLDIETNEGEHIATVTDVLFNFGGMIAYAIFDTGEFLEDGTTVAVNWDRIIATPATDTTTPPVLVYSADNEALSGETEIDTDVLDEEPVFVDTAQLGLDTDDERLLRASEFVGLTGYDVVNQEGENLGEVQDLVFDLEQGVVSYALMDVGGFLGVGENTVAIPWNLVGYNVDEENFTISVAAEDLEAAPTVDLGAIENEGFDEGWFEEQDTYWSSLTPPEGPPDAEDPDLVGGLGGPWILGERLLGLDIEAAEGDRVAEVEDVLFTFGGEIAYLVFDVADYLELDDSRFVAVPWNNFDAAGVIDATDTTTPTLAYTGTDADLEAVSAIDTAVWESDDILVDTADLGIDTTDLDLAADEDTSKLVQLSEFLGPRLIDFDVVNESDEDLGDLSDLVFNLEEGIVSYALMDVGGFLGIGENTVAIPWDLVSFDTEAEAWVIPVTSEDLEAAPTLDVGAIENEGFDDTWNEEHETYWADFGSDM